MILRKPRTAALAVIALLVAAASLVSFAESYRGLYEWAREHGLRGAWAVAWPVQVDVFIAVGELALFVALVDAWQRRSRAGAWTVTLAGLAVSVAGNVGHVAGTDLASRVTAAVPPLAAAAALAVGLGVLKRVVARAGVRQELTQSELELARVLGEVTLAAGRLTDDSRAVGGEPADVPEPVAGDAESAARAALAASVAASNPLSQRQLMTRFGLTRTAERKVRQAVLAGSNGTRPQ